MTETTPVLTTVTHGREFPSPLFRVHLFTQDPLRPLRGSCCTRETPRLSWLFSQPHLVRERDQGTRVGHPCEGPARGSCQLSVPWRARQTGLETTSKPSGVTAQPGTEERQGLRGTRRGSSAPSPPPSRERPWRISTATETRFGGPPVGN